MITERQSVIEHRARGQTHQTFDVGRDDDGISKTKEVTAIDLAIMGLGHF